MTLSRSTYRVIYGDTDQMGVVYYANYLALFERGRCEYMSDNAIDYAQMEREGSFLPVVEAHVKYRQPARFDDLVTIEADVTATSRVTLTFTYRVLRGDAVLCEGSTVHACVDANGKPRKLPQHLLRPAVVGDKPQG